MARSSAYGATEHATRVQEMCALKRGVMIIYMLDKAASLRARKLIWPKSTDMIKNAHQAQSQKVKREADGALFILID